MTPSNIELGLFRGDPDKGHVGWMCSARARLGAKEHYVVTTQAYIDPLEAVQAALLKLFIERNTSERK